MRVDLKKSLFILPNLFTVSSIFCGFYATLLSSTSGADDAIWKASLLIILAMFFDTIDGRVARLTKTQSAIGVQLDSLADVVSFGVAPGVLVYRWSLESLGTLGLFGAFLFPACGAIRLARFNVMAVADDGKPLKPSKYIMGLPIPSAAGILVSLVVANHAVAGSLPGLPYVVLLVVILLAFFMVSTMRFRSFKELKPTPISISILIIALAVSVLLTLKFHVAFALIWLLAAYVSLGIVETVSALVRHHVLNRRTIPPSGH